MSVAVVGLGRMGQALVRRLLDQGTAVAVWNRSPEAMQAAASAGARPLDSLADAWSDGGPVLTFLADDDAVESVCGELLAAAPEGALLIEMSTVSPAASARVAGSAQERGVAYLRAPVSGNPSVLAAGNLGIMVSGEAAVFERARPLLEAIGANVFYLGEGERARVMKLALQGLIAGTAQLLSEAIALGEAHGLDRADMLKVMGGSAVGSPFVGYKTAALVDRDYTATFSTRLLAKDLGLVLDAAGDLPLPIAQEVDRQTRMAIADGLGDLDFMALLVHLQRRAGVRTDLDAIA